MKQKGRGSVNPCQLQEPRPGGRGGVRCEGMRADQRIRPAPSRTCRQKSLSHNFVLFRTSALLQGIPMLQFPRKVDNAS
eukprot:3548485-Rhodomonas_salina.1